MDEELLLLIDFLYKLVGLPREEQERLLSELLLLLSNIPRDKLH